MSIKKNAVAPPSKSDRWRDERMRDHQCRANNATHIYDDGNIEPEGRRPGRCTSIDDVENIHTSHNARKARKRDIG
jgi:hypothetical protein